MYVSKTMVTQEQVEKVFSIALQCMDSKERDKWESLLNSYQRWERNPQPDKMTLGLRYTKQGHDCVKEMTASALNGASMHPVLSDWREQLEKIVAEQEKTLSDASYARKKKEPTDAERKALRETEISLSHYRFLLSYCTGLARSIHNVKPPIEYSPEVDLWLEVGDYLCEIGILRVRDIDGTNVFVPDTGFTGNKVFNEAVKAYFKKRKISYHWGKRTPLSIFVSLGLLYKPEAYSRYMSSDEVGKSCDKKKWQKNKSNKSK